MNVPKSYTVFRALTGTLVLVIGIVVAVVLALLIAQLIEW
jgi:hypothetical protein